MHCFTGVRGLTGARLLKVLLRWDDKGCLVSFLTGTKSTFVVTCPGGQESGKSVLAASSASSSQYRRSSCWQADPQRAGIQSEGCMAWEHSANVAVALSPRPAVRHKGGAASWKRRDSLVRLS